MKKDKGSIAIFVLVALLFMTAFLIISFASNVNKSKTVKEQFNIISEIYAYTNGDEGAYEKAYTALRNKNKQTMIAFSENNAMLELTKTFDENMSNYRIYGNSVQNGIPTPDNPVEVQSVGDLVTDTTDANYGKYKIPIKLTQSLLPEEYQEVEYIESTGTQYNVAIETTIYLNEPLRKIGDSADYIDFKEKKIYRNIQEKVIKGTENWRMLQASIQDNHPFIMTLPTSEEIELKGGYFTDQKNILCNFFKRISPGAVDQTFISGISSHDVDTKRITVRDTSQNRTLEEWKAYLAELYSNGTPMIIYFVRKEQIEETLALPELQTFEDYTRIEVLTGVTPSKIEAEYQGYTLE